MGTVDSWEMAGGEWSWPARDGAGGARGGRGNFDSRPDFGLRASRGSWGLPNRLRCRGLQLHGRRDGLEPDGFGRRSGARTVLGTVLGSA